MVRLDVPYIDQSVRYPTGCESVSAVMLLQYLGYSLTVDEFIEKYLEKADFEMRGGELWGADPRRYFCGSPYSEDGFGCYAPVICRALTEVFRRERPGSGRDDTGRSGSARDGQAEGGPTADDPALAGPAAEIFRAVDETGAPMERLLREYLDRGMPVIFWACIEMREPVVGPVWRLLDSGETFTWISNEHCMLLVGYDETGYYFNDPYGNHGVVHYDRELTEDRHRAQHSMAVGVRRL